MNKCADKRCFKMNKYKKIEKNPDIWIKKERKNSIKMWIYIYIQFIETEKIHDKNQETLL